MLKKFFKIIFSGFESPPAWPKPPLGGEGPPQIPQEKGGEIEKTEAGEQEHRPVSMFEELERRASGESPDIGAIEKELEEIEKEQGRKEPRGTTMETENSKERQEPQRAIEEELGRPLPFGSEPELEKHLKERLGVSEVGESLKERQEPQEATEGGSEKKEKPEGITEVSPEEKKESQRTMKEEKEAALPGHQFEGVLEEVKTRNPEAKEEIEKIDDEYKKFLKDAEMKISAIKDPEERSKECLNFIENQILKRGDVESARVFAKFIKNKELKDKAAGEIAKSMEKAGLDEKEIIDFISGKEGIKDKTKRDETLKDLRKILEIRNTVNENLDKQLELISKIPDEGKRNEAVAILAFEAAIVGNNLEWSLRLIMAITKDEIREKAVSHIVGELAEKGKGSEMKPFLEEIKNGDLKSETIGAIREIMERKLLGIEGILSSEEQGKFNKFKEVLKQAESSPDAKAKAEKWGKARKILLKILGWAGMIFGILALGAVGLALEKVAGQQKKG